MKLCADICQWSCRLLQLWFNGTVCCYAILVQQETWFFSFVPKKLLIHVLLMWKKSRCSRKPTQIMMKIWKSVICMWEKLPQDFLCLNEDKSGLKSYKIKKIIFAVLSPGSRWPDLMQPASCLHSKNIKEVSLNKKLYHI